MGGGSHVPGRNAAMPIGSDTDLQCLVDLARSGDSKAKALLLDHSCGRLLKLTRKMFRSYPGLRRWEFTDDVFQNALIRLHRALSDVELKPIRHFFNLAAVQIRRELLDLKKHHFGLEGHATHHHTDHHPPDEHGGTLGKTSDEPDDVSRWVEFHAAVGSLPTDLREVVDLLYYEGLRQEEAAMLLEISPRTLKRRWHEAKTLLHERLRGE
jgi:RNA polymerase sigma factor (sigma-70 family)